MTGRLRDVHPLIAAVLYSFEHARADLQQWTEGLTQEQIWRRSGEVAPVGFHILHIAGSVDRLITYASGEQLSKEQMADLAAEQDSNGPSREELLKLLDNKLSRAERILRAVDPSRFSEVREIGRKRLPAPLGVLLVHISEHTQRHVGAAIVTAKMVRQDNSHRKEAGPRHSEG